MSAGAAQRPSVVSPDSPPATVGYVHASHAHKLLPGTGKVPKGGCFHVQFCCLDSGPVCSNTHVCVRACLRGFDPGK